MNITRTTRSFNFTAPVAAVMMMVAGSITSVAHAQGPAHKINANKNGAKPDAKAEAKPEKPKVRVTDANLVDLHVKEENLNNVLEMLSIQGKKNIIVSKNVTGTVTMNLWNVTFYEALDALLHSNGFAYVEKGDFVYVYTLEEVEKLEKTFKQKKAKRIVLNYLNAPDAAEFVKGMLSKDGTITTTPKVDAFKIEESGPGGKDDFSLGAMLVIADYEENIKAIEQLLSEMDTKPAQVLIEATVLQTKLSEENAFGIDFSMVKSLNFSDFSTVTAGPRGVVDALISGGATATTGIAPASNSAGGLQSTVGGTSGKGGFKFGIISNDIAAFVRLLDEVTDTTVLAHPKLLTLNRQPSRVLVGRRVAYLSTTATETSSTQTVQYLDTGVQLYVRPFVSNTGDIRLEIKPQVSTADIKDIKGPSGNVVTVPDEVTQEVVTNIIVPDGMTVVIGGLFTETTVAGRSQVPGLGDLPLIGAAFRGNSDRTTRDEIIFLVTPTIVNDKTLIHQGEQARGVERRLNNGRYQQLLPWSREKMAAERTALAAEAARAGDFQKALSHVNSALSINPQYEDALRLRDRILGDSENWPVGSRLEGVVGTTVKDHMQMVRPPVEQPNYKPPFPQFDMPRLPLRNVDLQSNGTQLNDTLNIQQLPGYDKVAPLYDNSNIALTTPGEQPVVTVIDPALAAQLPATTANAVLVSPEQPVIAPVAEAAPAFAPFVTPNVTPGVGVLVTNVATPPSLPPAQPDVNIAKLLPSTNVAGVMLAKPAKVEDKPKQPEQQQATVPTEIKPEQQK